MKIQKIKIKNFGVYYGLNEIEMPLDKGKNIVLIDGNNGYGKTTLHRALWYCLYGIRKKYKERIDFMNKHALAKGELSTVVEIYFTYNGKHYQITRSIKASKPDVMRVEDVDESVTMLEDGVPVKNIENRINDILPKEASQFFFFDGEDIKKYASLENTEATKEAIELVLGIPAIRNAIHDLKTIQKDLTRKRNQEIKKSKDRAELAEREEKILEEIKIREEKLEEAKRKKAELLSLKEEIQNKMEEYNILQPMLNEKKKLEEKEKELIEKLKEIEKEEKEMHEKLPYLIVKPLIEKVWKEVLDKLTKEKEIHEEVTAAKAMIKEIEKLLKSGRCLCGNKIGNLEKKILIEKQKSYKKKLTETDELSMGKLIEKQQKLSEILQAINKTEIEYKNIMKRKEEILFEIDEVSSELKVINKKLIGALSQEKYENLKEKYEKISLQIAKLTENIKWAEEQYEALQREKEKIQNEILEIKIKSPKMEKLNKQITLITNSLKALNEYLERVIHIKKKRIEEEATKVFRELTHKKEVFSRVKINDDYTICIIDKDGEIVDNEKISAGEKQILALSFIAGLRRATDKDAPVIMDTPFGRLDHEHKINVMKLLHKLGNQIIILATDEDVNEDNIDIIAPYIGKKYEIRFLPDKKSSIIKEVV